jgi:hypothetical protein
MRQTRPRTAMLEAGPVVPAVARVATLHPADHARDIAPLRDLASLWRLWRLFRQERPDVSSLIAASRLGVVCADAASACCALQDRALRKAVGGVPAPVLAAGHDFSRRVQFEVLEARLRGPGS